ncbi:molybdenum cofactor biosynthesis protein MoaE [Acidipila sp. EB88]|uniref:molybdenum cofactor biosynthesis protein n=1 Tax=Acidipila sp. EB88 TaxID=2305226 RepID=UPI000F5F200F|nr:molybdenum cofactor biosynthesis protein MoaE [Acidipila sp. EB88]RRA47205.1 molybdopterin synthase [Acidipila sp. EB88]
MQVRVLFFGVLRETFGDREQSVELPGPDHSVGGLLRHLQTGKGTHLASLWPRLAVAVNREYAHSDHVLQGGEEVALLPPVSGGLGSDPATPGIVETVLLTDQPLRTDEAVAFLKAGSDGAVVVFDGIVRNNTRGRQTRYLVYEAYEVMALARMQALVDEAAERFSVRQALLHHRLGRLEIGETSVLIVVASAHRGAAFDACRWIIDTLKQSVPVWKKEYFVDGAVWADGEAFPPELQAGLEPGA